MLNVWLAFHDDVVNGISDSSLIDHAVGVAGICTGALVHEAGGRVFWDYAAAGPYVAMDASDKDAIFLSPHKFLGGPGTPGVLVVRKDLLTGSVPAVPGGGTVSFVSPDGHRYLEASR